MQVEFVVCKWNSQFESTSENLHFNMIHASINISVIALPGSDIFVSVFGYDNNIPHMKILLSLNKTWTQHICICYIYTHE